MSKGMQLVNRGTGIPLDSKPLLFPRHQEGLDHGQQLNRRKALSNQEDGQNHQGTPWLPTGVTHNM